MKLSLIILFVFVSVNLLFAWSDDPSLNTQISSLTGEQVIPRVATTSNRDFYISYFSNEAGNYNVRLQKVTHNGLFLWTTDGVLVSDHPQMTWLTDWDMKADNENNAILAFQDIRNSGNNNIYAYKIDPNGIFLWGEDGIELSNSTAFDASPKIGILESGNVIIAWQSEEKMYVQKISPEGDLLFGAQGIELVETGVSLSWPQVIPMQNDEFVLKYYQDSGPAWAPTRHIFAKKFAENGDVLWTSTISNAGGITAWTQILPIAKDENNGFFISWHEDRNFTNITNSYIQHINEQGNPTFAENGILVSNNSSYHQFYPKISYLPNSQEVIIIWNEMDGNQNNRGIFGQKINLNGDLLWGGNGMTFLPLELSDMYPISLQPMYNGAVCFYSLSNTIYAFRINENGDFIWENSAISTTNSSKSHIVVSEKSFNQWITVWEDDRNGNTDIYAQNLSTTSEMGNLIPVGFLDYNLEQLQDEIYIHWVTEWEINNLGWNIYRASEDNFDNAIRINEFDILGAGTINTPIAYEFDDEYDLVNDTMYYYWLESIQMFGYSNTIHIGSIAYDYSSQDNAVLTSQTFLSNFPNPFNPTTTIQFNSENVTENELITLEIFNIKGQRIQQFTLKNEKWKINEVVWDGRDEMQNAVSSGVYLYQIKTKEKVLGTEKMLLLK
jgi:hypothetical protein